MRWTLIAAVALLSGCVNPVVLDYQEDIAFGDYRTYALEEAPDTHALDSKRVRTALQRELPDLGLREAPRGEADLLVRHGFLETSDVDSTDVFWGVGAGGGRGGLGLGISAPVSTRERIQNYLQLQMVDTRREEVVWQARSKRAMDEDDPPAKRSERIGAIVKDMLDRYPPGD